MATNNYSVRKNPADLKRGDRIIFSAGMGGDGSIVTVDFVNEALEPALIHTDELSYPLEVRSINTVKFA